ncbi:uncharacterized protein AB675_9683 [Cyphellophora attinorum]|uniref:Clr5 domain-containing protein n=1 Tax=Cyphellophora attinorum TaxID=1664694 RepID=A0A0N1P1I9_9EURO|nr:uncharacterized protein AB675_9683 [Phialophora attinorum]KPI42267.1 hypothetical protein AB675_9683 [Phialophora attinorum]
MDMQVNLPMQAAGPGQRREGGHHLRKIPDSVWAAYDAEIIRLYLTENTPLKELQTYFRETYGFHATTKQWKDRLSRESIRRNLSRPAVAVIQCLLDEAEQRQIERQVFYNGKPKTRKDVQRYICKTTGISTPAELRQSLPPNRADWPKSVDWQDLPHSQPPSTNIFAPDQRGGPGGFFSENLSGNAQPSRPPAVSQATYLASSVASHISLGPFASSDFNTTFEPTDFTYSSMQIKGSADDASGWSGRYDESNSIRNLHTEASTQALATPVLAEQEDQDSQGFTAVLNLRGGAFDQLYGDMDSPGPAAAESSTRSPLSVLHGLVSATPIALSASITLAHALHQVLGRHGGLESSSAETFIRSCFEACVHYGQGAVKDAEHALDCGVVAFQTLMDGPPPGSFTKSISTLNRVSFLLEVYGHRPLKATVFQHLELRLIGSSKPQWTALQKTLGFLFDTTSWDQAKARDNVAKLSEACDMARLAAGNKYSPFALAARYNLAWTLLEAGQHERALEMLNSEKSKCEECFGPYALDTITWTATLARAHAAFGELETAVLLMEEVVLVRTEKAYSKEHPLYWEVRYRVGLFLLHIAEEGKRQRQTPETWAIGEELVKEALLWRGVHLGTGNPQFTNAFQLLKRYLRVQRKQHEASDIWTWYADAIKELQPT